MKQETAQKILAEVQSAYLKIAHEFNTTRQDLWPGFEYFLQYIQDGDRILDAGCGNGRLVKLFAEKSIRYTGCDTSHELIEIARRNFPNKHFVSGDLLHLPFENESFNVVFCIAALHHIPSQKYRIQAVAELRRVLQNEGILIVTNWDRYTRDFFPKIVRASLKKIFGLSNLDFKDVYIPWKNSAMRYYHCYTLREMRALVERSGFDILKAYRSKNFERKNLVVVAKKR